MALLKCNECDNMVSTTAKRCPKCGARAPKKSASKTAQFIGYIAIISIVAIIIVQCNKPETPLTPAEQHAKLIRHAAYECKYFINENLNDPKSAVYGENPSDIIVIEKKSGIWAVQRKLRARNAFNALIQATYICIMKYNGKNFDLISLKSVP